MTAIRRNRPIYIVPSDSEDGVYDAIPSPSEDHLTHTLLGQLLPNLKPGVTPSSEPEDEKIESPATGYTSPKNPPSGSTGLGAAADFVNAPLKRRMPYFFFFAEAAAGDLICYFHLPRRLLLKVGLLFLLLLASALLIIGILS